MTGPPRAPSKQQVATALLEGPSVFVHLDPRRDGVVVPPWLSRRPQLVLQVGYHLAVPIPDLVVDEQGMRCSLSFNRSPHWCSVPWSAIYALVGERGESMVWPDDVPAELAAAGTRPRLQVVKGGRQSPEDTGARAELTPTGRSAESGDQTSLAGAASAEAAAMSEPLGGAPGAVADAAAAAEVEPVDDPLPDAPDDSAPATDGDDKPRRPPWLRLIK